MAFSLESFIKKLPIPFVYAASGWLITEIPVLVGVIPSTFDGYSTATVVGGLGFVLSAAYWVHQELSPFITPSTSTGASATTPASTITTPPTPPTAPTITWTQLLALEGTATSASQGTIVSIADNPTSSVVWYAVSDDTGHVVLTNINPS